MAGQPLPAAVLGVKTLSAARIVAGLERDQGSLPEVITEFRAEKDDLAEAQRQIEEFGSPAPRLGELSAYLHAECRLKPESSIKAIMPSFVGWCLLHDPISEHGEVSLLRRVKQAQYWKTAEVEWTHATAGDQATETTHAPAVEVVDLDYSLLESFRPAVVASFHTAKTDAKASAKRSVANTKA
jgi:hypothetical protein